MTRTISSTEHDEVAARLQREAEFHDHVAEDDTRVPTQKFYAAARNSQEYFLERVFANVSGRRVLDYGCGTGSNTFELARRGAMVTGIDISPGAIEVARRRAEADGLADRIDLHVMNAEALELPDNHFDQVCGTGILHHLDLDACYREIHRVLKPGGVSIFMEPMGHTALINWYRNRTPEMRTEDEHPLMLSDIEHARSIYSKVDVKYFHITSLATVPFRNSPLFGPLYAITETIDRVLMALVPPLRGWAWMAVMTMTK
jgi:2-polyprenyl-3-methyl-5-hydroxy-6-metoxy-1,4-benzoquinol methylase